MTHQTSIIARIEYGEPKYSEHQKELLNKFYKKHDKKFVQLTLRQQGKPRSSQENRYYWSVIVGMIAEDTGNEPERVHEALKEMFLGREFVRMGTKEMPVPKSTKELSTYDFEIYAEQCRAFAASELGLRIPLPHESLE